MQDGVAREKGEEGGGKGALTAAGFSKHSKDFAGGKLELNASQSRSEVAAGGGVRDAEILHLKKRFHGWSG